MIGNSSDDNRTLRDVRLNDAYELHRTACGYVVFDMERLKPVASLNSQAALVWCALKERTPVSDIVQMISDEMRVDLCVVSRDIDEVIQDFMSKDMTIHSHTVAIPSYGIA